MSIGDIIFWALYIFLFFIVCPFGILCYLEEWTRYRYTNKALRDIEKARNKMIGKLRRP